MTADTIQQPGIALAAATALACSLAICIIPLSASVQHQQIKIQHPRAALTTVSPNLNINIVAHRGASKFAPENTLPAIVKAIAMGAQFIELDIRISADGTPVIIHDKTVDRTTNGTGIVGQLSLAELQQLDAGSWFDPTFAGARIPTLEEALAVIAGKACVLWDPKSTPTRPMVALFKRYNIGHGCLLVAFGPLGAADDPAVVAELLKLWPDAPIMPGAKDVSDVAEQLERYPQAGALRVMRTNLSDDMVAAAHAAGVPIYSSTLIQADTIGNYDKVMDSGADFILLDNLDDLLELLERRSGER